MFRRLLALTTLLFVLNNASAQQYHFINYSIKQGLAQTQARAICQDNKGYLWIATITGVSQFDGNKFNTYTTEDGLLSNTISSIIVAKNGDLWFGALGGVIRYNGYEFQNFPFPTNNAGAQVLSLVEGENGTIWAATNGAGLAKFDGNEWEHFGDESSGGLLSNDVVRWVTTGKNGALWIGTFSGLNQYKDGKFIQDPIQGLENVNVSCVISDESNRVWVGTQNKGVFRYDGNELVQFTEENGLASNTVRHLHNDVEGNIWMSSSKGLTKIAESEVTVINNQNGLPTNPVRYVFQDNEHNLWISTDGKGILKFSGEAFVNFDIEQGLCADAIMSISEDQAGNFWFGTYNRGVCVYDPTTDQYQTISPADGILHKRVWATLTDSKGRVWCGTTSGINIFHPDGSMTTLTEQDGLIHNKVNALLEDRDGRILIGTSRGISIFEDDSLTNFDIDNGFPGRYVRSIIQEEDGTFLMGSAGGLIAFDGKNFKSYTTEDGLTSNTIFCIEKDDEGLLWIGTENGLNYWDGKTFKSIRVGEEYSGNYINFLLHDDSGSMWIGTNRGLFRLTRSNNGETQFEIRLYSDLEGIPSLETNQNAAFKDSKGRLWFGTSESLVRFDPSSEKIIESNIKPFVYITEIRLFLNETDWSKLTDSVDNATGLPHNLQLPFDQNYLTFYFTGISHTNPDKVRYKFMLEGFDKDWSPISDAKSHTYTNLPHGEYTLKVLARNKDGIWSSEPATFSFTIITPFWLTWWFLTLCVIVGLGAVYFIIAWRSRLDRRKQETEQLVNRSKMLALEQQTLNASMNRHFIFNALNSIQYYINRQDRLAANKYLTSFAKLVRKNLDSSTTNLVSLSEELERLELYLVLEHMRFQEKFKYNITVDPQLDAESTKVPAMLLQPYVENSIWHGILPMEKDGLITVDIKRSGNTMIFSIEDNGIGIQTSMKQKQETSQDHISKGMEITSGRINLLRKMTNETIYINGPYEMVDDDQNSLGTKVEIVLPLDENYLWN